MPKKVSFSAKPTAQFAENWVNGNPQNALHSTPQPSTKPASHNDIEAVNMKRLTLDIPENLHRRIKAQCAMKNTKMVDEIRLLLEEKFPTV